MKQNDEAKKELAVAGGYKTHFHFKTSAPK